MKRTDRNVLSISSRRLNSPKGFTVLELAVAFIATFGGAVAAFNLYHYVAHRNHTLEVRKALNSVGDLVRKDLLLALASDWTMLADNNCDGTNSQVNFSVSAAGSNEYAAELITGAKVEEVVPSQLPGSIKPNPLRVAIDKLIQSYGVEAGKKCNDPAVIAQPDYAVIGQNSMNQAMCRCLAASTAYGTIQAKASSLGASTGLYACTLLSPKSSQGVNQMTAALQNSKVVVESNYSEVNVASGSSYACSNSTTALSTADKKAQSASRLYYFVYQLNPLASNEDKDAYISGSLVAER